MFTLSTHTNTFTSVLVLLNFQGLTNVLMPHNSNLKGIVQHFGKWTADSFCLYDKFKAMVWSINEAERQEPNSNTQFVSTSYQCLLKWMSESF